ncbi:putative short-chain dehydrogenase [Xylariomycetidae sp. FL2044]|nr:putative short-chain dehydrogenase [Xylariomycetidae sp. FL2044]
MVREGSDFKGVAILVRDTGSSYHSPHLVCCATGQNHRDKNPMSSSHGTILLTGANGGLGSTIARKTVTEPELRGFHGVFTVRDVTTAMSLQQALSPGRDLDHHILPLDLCDLTSVRETAANINAKVESGEIPPIRALILNAGRREPQGQSWVDSGLDFTFIGNYLGHWLLVLLLLQSMDRESGRIIVISSQLHDPHYPGNKIHGAFTSDEFKTIFANSDRDTVESIAKGRWSASQEDPSQDPQGLCGMRRYGASKLCLVMMIPELQRRLDSDPELRGISILGVDPGTMPTRITVGTLSLPTKLIFHIVARIAVFFSPNGIMRTPSKSAGDVLSAALVTSAPFGEKPKGLYLNGSELQEISQEAKDANKRTGLWKASIEYTGLQGSETCLVDWA